MNELFVKYFIITSAILVPVCVIFGIIYFIVKNGINIACQKIINIIDYLIDKIEGDLKNMLKFITESLINIFNTFCNQALNLYIIAESYDVIISPPQGWAETLISVLPLFIVIRKGNVDIDINKITDAIKEVAISKTNQLHKNENTQKQD